MRGDVQHAEDLAEVIRAALELRGSLHLRPDRNPAAHATYRVTPGSLGGGGRDNGEPVRPSADTKTQSQPVIDRGSPAGPDITDRHTEHDTERKRRPERSFHASCRTKELAAAFCSEACSRGSVPRRAVRLVRARRTDRRGPPIDPLDAGYRDACGRANDTSLVLIARSPAALGKYRSCTFLGQHVNRISQTRLIGDVAMGTDPYRQVRRHARGACVVTERSCTSVRSPELPLASSWQRGR